MSSLSAQVSRACICFTVCASWAYRRGSLRWSATEEAQEAWVAHVNEVARNTLSLTCHSWYLGANIPGKPRVFMPLPGFPPYVEKCEEVVVKGYEGFLLS